MAVPTGVPVVLLAAQEMACQHRAHFRTNSHGLKILNLFYFHSRHNFPLPKKKKKSALLKGKDTLMGARKGYMKTGQVKGKKTNKKAHGK